MMTPRVLCLAAAVGTGHSIDSYKYWPQTEYKQLSSRNVYSDPILLTLVRGPTSNHVPAGRRVEGTAMFMGTGVIPAGTVVADAALDGELTLMQLHDIATTKYASDATPVWQVHATSSGGPVENLIYMLEWAGEYLPHVHSDGGDTVENEQWSVGIITSYLKNAEQRAAAGDGGTIVANCHRQSHAGDYCGCCFVYRC